MLDYLTKGPTPADATIAEQCDTHTGGTVPFWMLLRVAEKIDEVTSKTIANTKWISARRTFEKRMRNLAVASFMALLGSVGTWAASAQGHARDSGIEQERVDQIVKRLDGLEHRIDVIQQTLMHKSEAEEPHSDFFSDPEFLQIPSKFTLLDDPAINPKLCSNTCNSNLQCRSLVGGRVCGVCVAGSCSQILPPIRLP